MLIIPPTLSSLSSSSLHYIFFLPNKSPSYIPIFVDSCSTAFKWICFHEYVWEVTWARAIYHWLHQRMTLLLQGGVEPCDTPPPKSMMECWWIQSCAWAHYCCEFRQGFLNFLPFYSFFNHRGLDHWEFNTKVFVSLLLFSCFFLLWNISLFSPDSPQMYFWVLGLQSCATTLCWA